MQWDVGVESEVATQSVLTWAQSNVTERGTLEWQSVDNALRALHARRCGVDAEEARWLRAAEALQIWRPLGMVSAIDYMERVLGYAPRTAKERLRVARALGNLPLLDGALARGELSYSAARELTRIATPDNEVEWISAVHGLNLRQIEVLVADRKSGDRPTDPRDPTARVHVVRLELSAETFALLRQTRQVLDDEHGTSMTEDQLIAAMCHAVGDGHAPGEATGRAKFQIAVTLCERCQQGWQHGAGAKVPISAAAVDRALCDAQHIGSVDDEAPARAYQDVAPNVARLVWHRDAGRCRVPGCRSGRGLEIHHIIHRADGGGHEPSNLVLACSSCHQAHHAGTLSISGTAEQLEVRRPGRAMFGHAIDRPVLPTPETRSSLVGTAMATFDVRAPAGLACAGDIIIAPPSIANHMDAATAASDHRASADGPARDSISAPAISRAADDHATASAALQEPRTATARGGTHADTAVPSGDARSPASVPTACETSTATARSGALVEATAASAEDRRPASVPTARETSTASASGGTHVDTTAASAEDRRPANAPTAWGTSTASASGGTHVDTTAAKAENRAPANAPTAWETSTASASGGTHVDMTAASAEDRGLASAPSARLASALIASDQTRLREDAKRAMIQTGWKPAVARVAVDDACRAGAATTLEQLLFEAFRRCAQRPS